MEPVRALKRFVIVYDGQCRFCRRRIEWIRKRDAAGLFEFTASDSPKLLVRFPSLADEELSSGLRFIDGDRNVRCGADAVYEIARRLPRWRCVAWLYCVPGLRGMARLVYARIAARRDALR